MPLTSDTTFSRSSSAPFHIGSSTGFVAAAAGVAVDVNVEFVVLDV